MTVYIRTVGISDDWIGVCRGLASITGFIGASIYPFLVKQFGIYRTGFIALLYQTILVAIAAISFILTSNRLINTLVLIVSVLLSRAGLWGFDLSARQIAQETIPESLRNEINGIWKSSTAFFDMTVYILVIIFPNPKDFGY
eukprot:gene22323-28909_t